MPENDSVMTSAGLLSREGFRESDLVYTLIRAAWKKEVRMQTGGRLTGEVTSSGMFNVGAAAYGQVTFKAKRRGRVVFEEGFNFYNIDPLEDTETGGEEWDRMTTEQRAQLYASNFEDLYMPMLLENLSKGESDKLMASIRRE